jgi:LmbE family N-acetylglucosaminyl deacetylase
VHASCAPVGPRRQITVRPRELHEALVGARTEQTSAQWKARYTARADIEGTMRQAAHVIGIRRARYLELPKTQFEHDIAAAAINMIRIYAY